MENNFDLKKFLTENKLTSNSRQVVNENIEAFSDTIQVVGYPKTVEDALKVIERYERDRDPVSREEAKEIIADMRATDDDDFDRNITNLIVKAFNIKLKGVNEIDADSSEGFMGVGKDISGVPLKKDDPTKLQATLTRGGFPNKKEQQVIDIARDAFALMDEQPGTSAEDALNSVLGL